MTEQPTPAPVQIGINTQYIKDLSFESPSAPQIFTSMTAAPALEVSVNVQTRPLGETVFEVTLIFKIDAQAEDKKAFIAELTYAGVFTLPKLPEEQLKYILLVEAPRMLFPFARNIVANAVRDGGFPQLLIQPIDFGAMFQAQQEQINKPAAGSA